MTAAGVSLPDRVREYIARQDLLQPGDRVLAAVSGGLDSMALLHLLRQLGYAVTVAHFDHQTRNGESTRDAQALRTLCAQLDFPFLLGTAPVAALAHAAGQSFEEAARAARYAFFQKTAAEAGCGVLATGHHRGDQAETVLMRVLAGTAGRGLAGIPPCRGEGGLRLVRPLLDCTKAELQAWLVEQGVAWREDASNADPVYRRNRLRHSLLPLLAADYNPNIEAALARLAEAQRLDNQFLEAALDDWLEKQGIPTDAGAAVDRGALAALPEALRRRWWVRFVEALGGHATFDGVVEAELLFARALTGARLDAGHGATVYFGRDAVIGLAAGAGEAVRLAGAAVPLPESGEAAALGAVWRVARRKMDDMPPGGPKAWCTPYRQVFDADKLPRALAVRTRCAGDRFQPFGMQGTRKLQDYLLDRGVPEPLRDQVPLVITDGTIVWVVGHAPAAVATVTAETRKLVEIELL